MKNLRPLFFSICPVVLLAGLVSVPLVAQNSSAPSVSASPTTAQAAPANPQQAYRLPPDKLAKAIAINRIRNILSITGSLWGIVFLWLLLAARGWSGLERWTQRVSSHRWVQGVLFFAVFIIAGELASLPLDMIGEHYERAYAVSVQGWGGWFKDQGISLGLGLLFGVPIYLLFNWIVRRWPRRYWVGIWAVAVPILVLVVFISPWFVPLYYQQEPLEKNHAALVAKMETVVARTGINIPPDRMYLIKAGEKSNGLNAFVTGMGATKRFVMWDTATDRMPDDQILFVFGHESGHYVLHHIPKEIAGDAIALFFVFWAGAVFAAWLVRRKGANWGAPDMASRTGFVVLLFTISIVSFLLEPLGNAWSRHFEHQADVYGQEAIHGIVPDPQKTAVGAFDALGEAWLEDPDPNPIIEFWLYSHPSVQHRANFALHYDPWANGGHGEFFKN